MATVCEPVSFVWTRESYEIAGEAGVFGDLRVELIDGEVVQMSPMKARHAAVCGIIADSLEKSFGPSFHTRVQFPLDLGDHSEPEPDVAVIRGFRKDYVQSHPKTAELVVEVSETTLDFDRKNKVKIYSIAGIPEYWIANLKAGQIEVFRQPDSNGKYLEQFQVKIGEQVSPLGAPKANLSVSELLPS